MLTISCPSCSHENRFDQPYRYHAGFSNDGFLYNEAGNLTLVWSSFDPAFEAIVGKQHPWSLSPEHRRKLEDALLPSPAGDRWLFANLPRCTQCREPIGGSILTDIHYVLYPGSIDVGDGQTLGEHLRPM